MWTRPRNLQALGLNTKERAGILVLVNRLINLEDEELQTQYFNEIKKMKGDKNMAELGRVHINKIKSYNKRYEINDEWVRKNKTLNA